MNKGYGSWRLRASGILTMIHVIPYGITVKQGLVPNHNKLYVNIQTPTDNMIADGLTKLKSPYTYATFEANRIGVYALPIQLVS